MTAVNKTLISPPQYETLMALKREVFKDLRCALPGTIKGYDTASRTATVQVGVAQVLPSGQTRAYPLLVDVPVLAQQGGGAALSFPIKVGDECLVFFADRCIDAWHQNGGASVPPDARLHDLSDGFALVGPNSLANALDTCLLSTEAGIATATSKVGLDVATGLVAISTEGGANSLKDALTILFTALEADPGLSGASHTALAAAISALALILK